MTQHKHPSVLVTGGSGFVGRHVAEALTQRGHHVIATTAGARLLPSNGPALRWVAWDATREALPDVDWHGIRSVIHLAMPHAPRDGAENARQMYDTTVASTFNLLEAAKAHGVRRMLMASTGDVLGHREQPARESDVNYDPRNFYGTAKACAELLTRSYSDDLSTAILRFYHPYGPGGERYLIHRLIDSVSAGRAITLEGKDGIRLNPVWVGDLADGVCQALASNETGVFHLSGPELMSLRVLAERIGMNLGREPVFRILPIQSIQRHAADDRMTQQRLDYAPAVSLDEGLARLLRSAVEVA